MAPIRSAACTSPRRSRTAPLLTRSGGRREIDADAFCQFCIGLNERIYPGGAREAATRPRELV
jgi:hypothetical protein